MKRIFFTIALLCSSSALAACGGGGGSGGTGSSIPPTEPPPATATPAPLAIAGKVAQLAGPLAANGSPSPQSTPIAGAGIAGATVYVTAATTAALAAPTASPIATVTTAPDGSFTATLPASVKGGNVGLVAVNGTLGPNGFTTSGYTVGHTLASVGTTNALLYVDTLTPNEQSGFVAYNAARLALGQGLPVATSDTTLEMTARIANTVNIQGAYCNGGDSGVTTQYDALGGVNPPGSAMVGTFPATPYYNTWPSQLSFPGQTSLDFAAFEGPQTAPDCPPFNSLTANYFTELLLTN